jgi:hypothetical protein
LLVSSSTPLPLGAKTELPHARRSCCTPYSGQQAPERALSPSLGREYEQSQCQLVIPSSQSAAPLHGGNLPGLRDEEN